MRPRLIDSHPDIASELVDQSLGSKWAGGSDKRVEWECRHGHRWFAKINNRTVNKTGCPVCSGRAVIPGVNDIATTDPLIAAQLVDSSLARTVSRGSDRSTQWECVNGHRWTTRISHRISGSGCPVCLGRKVTAGVNDLTTTHPDVASTLVDGSLATALTHGSSVRTDFACQCGFMWAALVHNRTAGHGCPRCANSGFNTDSTTAILYAILPPNGHPIGFGKVQSSTRLKAAMGGPYKDCALLITATGSGLDVSAAENELKQIVARPIGNRHRLRTESLYRCRESIKVWVDTAERHGLIVDIVDSAAISELDASAPPITIPASRKRHCHHDENGVSLCDSSSECCKSARSLASSKIAASHYLGSFGSSTVHCFTWSRDGEMVAVMTLGTGSSARAASSLSAYSNVPSLELTRLWASPEMDIPLSSFVSRCLSMIDHPLFVFSYADSSQGHTGGIYRACSFNYSGWTDMNRSQPLRRPGGGSAAKQRFDEWKVLSAKHRYWKLIGVSGKKRIEVLRSAGWDSLDPKILGYSPISGHRRVTKDELQKSIIAAR